MLIQISDISKTFFRPTLIQKSLLTLSIGFLTFSLTACNKPLTIPSSPSSSIALHQQNKSSSSSPNHQVGLPTSPINYECKMYPNTKITQNGITKDIATALVTCFSPATYHTTGIIQFFTNVESKIKARLLAFEQALYPVLSAARYNQLTNYQVVINQVDTSSQGMYFTSHITYRVSYRLPSYSKLISETGTLTVHYKIEKSYSTLLNIQSDKINLETLLPLQPGKKGDSPVDYPIRSIIERTPEIGLYPPPKQGEYS